MTGRRRLFSRSLRSADAELGRRRAGAQREGVGRELVPAREGVLERLQQEAHEGEPEAEDDERAVGGPLEREGRVEGLERQAAGSGRRRRRRSWRRRARCAQRTWCSLKWPSSWASTATTSRAPIASSEGVEEHDPLLAEDAGEVGVAVGGAARGVHHEDAARPEARAAGEVEDRLAQLAVRQRREAVEERREHGRVDPGGEAG